MEWQGPAHTRAVPAGAEAAAALGAASSGSHQPLPLGRTADPRWLFSLAYLAGIFSKMNKASLSLPGKRRRSLLPVVESELSSKNQDFGKRVSASTTTF